MEASISGAVVAQVATEAQSGSAIFEGLLFGQADTLVTETLTDSDEKQTKIRTLAHITGACVCGTPCQWFTTSGRMQQDLLDSLIAEFKASGQDLIGWFSCREAATAAYMPAARERAVCSRLMHACSGQPLLYGLFFRDALLGSEPLGFYLELFEVVHSSRADNMTEPPCELKKTECSITNTNVGSSRAQAAYRNVSSFPAILPALANLNLQSIEGHWEPNHKDGTLQMQQPQQQRQHHIHAQLTGIDDVYHELLQLVESFVGAEMH